MTEPKLTPAEARYIGKAQTPDELLRRLHVITDEAGPKAPAPPAPRPQGLPRELNPENPGAALFVGCWALAHGTTLCRVVARELGFGHRTIWWTLVPRGIDAGSAQILQWGSIRPLPHTDPRVLEAVAYLERLRAERHPEPAECLGTNQCRCGSCRWAAERDAAPPDDHHEDEGEE